MRLNTYFPRDYPPILDFLFPQLQLTALVPISKIKPSLTENPWGYVCREPELELEIKSVSQIKRGSQSRIIGPMSLKVFVLYVFIPPRPILNTSISIYLVAKVNHL